VRKTESRKSASKSTKARVAKKATRIGKVPTGYQKLLDSERRLAPGAKLIGRTNPDEIVTVRIRVRRRQGAPPLPDVKEWASLPYADREYVSRAEFARTYGASQADLDKVQTFAAQFKLTVTEVSAARRTVMLSGTVRSMQKAFVVQLSQYKTPTETYRGREGHVHIPKSLASIITGVFGLDNRRMAARASVPAGANPLTPPQVARLYGFPNNLNASGESIGLIEFEGGFEVNSAGAAPDVDAFFQGMGLSSPVLIAAPPIDGVGNSPTGNSAGPDAEVLLDIEVAGSVAPGADIVVYFAPWTELGWTEVIAQAVQDIANRPSVISISWGWAEEETALGLYWTPAAMKDVSCSFREAAAMGVTVLVASGDDGSNCNIGDGSPHVSYPASDPWVTACGGTIITDVVGDIFTENTWNDKRILPEGYATGGATGGGISKVFELPAYQAGVGVPHSKQTKSASPRHSRGVPDLAGNASGYSGYTVNVDGMSQTEGGTSAVAPLYAGLFACLNRILHQFGANRLGFLNPFLYANRAKIFRDIDDGRTNSVDFGGFATAPGTSPGYKSAAGWDACTGLGVIRGSELLFELLPKPPREWLLDPWRLILYPVYVKLHLPDPPPDFEAIAAFTKRVAEQLSDSERKEVAKGAAALATYANTMKNVLLGEN
jgi:kumamolisin